MISLDNLYQLKLSNDQFRLDNDQFRPYRNQLSCSKCSTMLDWIFQQEKQQQDGIIQLIVVWLFLSQENLFEMRSLLSWKCWLAHTCTQGLHFQWKVQVEYLSFIAWRALFSPYSFALFSGAIYFGKNYHNNTRRARLAVIVIDI